MVGLNDGRIGTCFVVPVGLTAVAEISSVYGNAQQSKATAASALAFISFV